MRKSKYPEIQTLLKLPTFISVKISTNSAQTSNMASAPKTLTRVEAMTLLTASGKYTEQKLAKMEKLDDEDFDDMLMPLATSLMKKTKAPAKVQLTDEQKAKMVYDKKIAYLQSLVNAEYVETSSKGIAMEMEILPSIAATYLTEEQVASMTKPQQKKLTKCAITKRYLDTENMDADEYNESVKEYKIVVRLIQNAAYSMFLDDLKKKPNRFTQGNMKINAAGKVEKMGGKQEKTSDELEGQITITNTHGKIEQKTLQKNDATPETHHQLRRAAIVDGIEETEGKAKHFLRMKNCGSCSDQTAICEYTTPYSPSELRTGGCNAAVYMKDVGEFMVEKTGDTTYTKVAQKNALTFMPCFRVCNRDCKDGTTKCGTHQRHTSPSKKMLEIADATNFQLGSEWTAENANWYNTY